MRLSIFKLMVSNVKSFKNSILKLDIFQAYHLLHRYILFNARTKKSEDATESAI